MGRQQKPEDTSEPGKIVASQQRSDALAGTDWSDAMAKIDDFEQAGSMPFTIHQGTNDNDTPLEFTLREKRIFAKLGPKWSS